jgi:hypothetical protein
VRGNWWDGVRRAWCVFLSAYRSVQELMTRSLVTMNREIVESVIKSLVVAPLT